MGAKLSSLARELPDEGPPNTSLITQTKTDDVRRICFAHRESVPCVNFRATVRSLAACAAANDVSYKSLEINIDYFPSSPHNKTACHPEAGVARRGTSHRLKR